MCGGALVHISLASIPDRQHRCPSLVNKSLRSLLEGQMIRARGVILRACGVGMRRSVDFQTRPRILSYYEVARSIGQDMIQALVTWRNISTKPPNSG